MDGSIYEQGMLTDRWSDGKGTDGQRNQMDEQVDRLMDMEGNTFRSNNKQIEKKKINFDNFCQMKNIMLDTILYQPWMSCGLYPNPGML